MSTLERAIEIAARAHADEGVLITTGNAKTSQHCRSCGAPSAEQRCYEFKPALKAL